MSTYALTALLLLAFYTIGCGGTTAKDDAGVLCVPGRSISCAGQGGCSGDQVCNAGGTGYGICDCVVTDGGGTDAGDAAIVPDVQSSDGAGTDASISPAAVPGLVLWLFGDVGVLGAPSVVAAWADQSGNGNDAKQSDSTRYPAFVSNAINGHGAVRFPPGDFLLVADATTLQFGSGPFAIIVVVLPIPNIDPNIVLYKFGGSDGWGTGINSSFSFFLTPGPAMSAPVAATFHVVTMRAPAMELRVDGVSTFNGTATGSHSASGVGINIGSGNATDPNMSGMELAEVVVVKGALSDADMLGVEAHLKAKYGL